MVGTKGTEKTMSGPEICTEGTEGALRDPEVNTEGTDFFLIRGSNYPAALVPPPFKTEEAKRRKSS